MSRIDMTPKQNQAAADTNHNEFGWPLDDDGTGRLDAKGSNESWLRMRRILKMGRIDGGWIVAERFNDRFDTEVGQRVKVVTQYLGDNGDIRSNLDLRNIESLPTETAPSVIVDYDNDGKYITESEAEGQLEFSDVLARLRERSAEYAQFMVGRDQ
jgi:hypothetical protein